MGGGRCLFHQDRAQARIGIFQQLRRAETARNKYAAFLTDFRLAFIPAQNTQKTVIEVFEIMKAFAQIGIACALQAGPVFAAGAVNRRFCGQAGLHAFLQLLSPGRVMRQEAVGLHNVAWVFPQRGAVQRHHPVDGGFQFLHAFFQTTALGKLVCRKEFCCRNHGVVQNGAAIAEAFTENPALKAGRVAFPLFIAAIVQRDRVDPVDNLCQHHGNGLKVVDFLIIIGTLCAVLYGQNADDASAPKDRHAQKCVERVFPCFRTVGE